MIERKIERKDLDKRIKVILALCQSVNKLSGRRYGTKEHKTADNAFWETVWQLDGDSDKGRSFVWPGRLVRWPVKDGYARYIVSRVGKKTCKVVHIPYAEGYVSNFVQDNEADTDEIKRNLAFYDDLKEVAKKELASIK